MFTIFFSYGSYTVSLVSWHTPLGGTTACCEKKKWGGTPNGGTPACCEKKNTRWHTQPCQTSALTLKLSKKERICKLDGGTLACWGKYRERWHTRRWHTCLLVQINSKVAQNLLGEIVLGCASWRGKLCNGNEERSHLQFMKESPLKLNRHKEIENWELAFNFYKMSL